MAWTLASAALNVVINYAAAVALTSVLGTLVAHILHYAFLDRVMSTWWRWGSFLGGGAAVLLVATLQPPYQIADAEPSMPGSWLVKLIVFVWGLSLLLFGFFALRSPDATPVNRSERLTRYVECNGNQITTAGLGATLLIFAAQLQ